MDIKEKIKPFFLVENADDMSLLLNTGSYKSDIFQERSSEGSCGNGYDWSSLAETFIIEKVPYLHDTIDLDPEADMFCAYSNDKEALLEFALAFHDMCEDDGQMRDLFSRTELD